MSTNENRRTLSGAVHGREEEGDETPSPRRLRRDDEASTAYDHPQVLCFAARNRRGRFYIPSKRNSFGDVHVDNVLFDSGCSSLLLPFPLEAGFPPALLESAMYNWIVSSSRGTGAVHSPVLKILPHLRGRGFDCTLADKEQPRLKMLRFHLGSQAANRLLSEQEWRRMLDSTCISKLNNFLSQLGSHAAPERSYALLGQSYLSQVMYCQSDDVALAFSKQFSGNDNVIHILGRYHQKLALLVEEFEGFHDLEDDDGDEDEEDFRLSWDMFSGDEIDEPDDR